MAQIQYRANLSAAKFPLVSQYMGRTVIVPKQDNTYVPQVAAKEDTDKDRGIPQIYYAHNVFPTGEGYNSIGYDLEIPPPISDPDFTQIWRLSGTSGISSYFCHHIPTGRNWAVNGAIGDIWQELDVFGIGAACTVAKVQGVWFINFSLFGTYVYDFTFNTLSYTELVALVDTDVLGITSSNGYLIAWTKLGVFWSSTISVTDFTPSIITGAGGGSVEQAAGAINYCAAQTLGFVVYCESNIVVAPYSGNARYPFNFRELVGSGGLDSDMTSDNTPQVDLVTVDAANGAHYALTTSGLQQISMQAAKSVYSEVTDFLSGLVFEDFDETSLRFTVENLITRMKRKLSFVADRYLVVSYGSISLTHAIVIDTVLNRWGKVKIAHTACFEYRTVQSDVDSTDIRGSIGFLQADGTIYTANLAFNPADTTSNGVALFGKYQYVRDRFLTLQAVEFENVAASQTFACYDLPAVDGKNFSTPVAGYLDSAAGNLRSYSFRNTAKNHSILAIGGFYLDSLLLTFNVAGRR